MHKYKKRGSILFKNLFSILLITMLYISISRVININVKAMRSILLTKDIINKIDIIKYELFFNNQYIHIKGDTYINANNIKLDKYKELKPDVVTMDITIEYIKDDQMIFKDKLEI